jgi:drug/metabolite transporter (DMT)-like permease
VAARYRRSFQAECVIEFPFVEARMPYLQFAFVCLVWSVSFLLMKKAAIVFSPAEVAFGRVVGGAAILAVIWLARDRQWSLRRSDWAAMCVVVVAGCAWPYFIQPWVISRQGSAFMALMVSFVPLLTIGFSLALLRTLPTWRQGLGVLGALGCLAMLMLDGVQRSVPLSQLALALTVPLGYAAANTVIRKWLTHVTSVLLTGVSFVLTASVLAPFAWTMPGPDGSVTSVAATSVATTSVAATSEGMAAASTTWRIAFWSLAVLAVVGTGVATYVFNHLVRRHGPLFAGMTTNVVPLGAVVWGWIDGEPISQSQFVAMLGILAMVSLVQYGGAARSR